jgi:hypothetical protein
LRVVGALLLTQAVFGFFWPPMHKRVVLAAGGGTLTDSLHLVWAAVNGLFFLLAVGFGAASLGKQFRVYSTATMVILLACAVVNGTYAAPIQANLPTPWAGVWERLTSTAYMVWVAVLAMALFSRPARRSREPPDRNGDEPCLTLRRSRLSTVKPFISRRMTPR